MSKKSATNKVVRKSAAEVPRASKADLARLREAMKGEIDTSEIPERRKFNRLLRDENGKLPVPKGRQRKKPRQASGRLASSRK